jgi:SPP1 gp7 family putative phage head morphogenesis protein
MAEAAYRKWARSVLALWANQALALLERSRTELVTREQIDRAWDELLTGAGLSAALLRVTAAITKSNATYFRSVLKTTPPGYDARSVREAWLVENFTLWDKLGAELADRLATAFRQHRLDAKPAGVTRAVNAARKENVALIKGIDPTTAKALGAALKSGQEQGVRHEQLVEQVTAITGYGGARAKLIARDQTMKFNSSVMQAQARAAGITQYRWRTTRLENVRPYHKRLENTLHSWNDPPITNPKGDRNHPGEDYQCACQAEPVIELFAGLSDD